MNIIFFNIDESDNLNKTVKVSAGLTEENPFVEFLMNIGNIDSVELETFIKKVDKCKSCVLNLGNNESLKYDYLESMVSFDLHNIKISLVNKCAPEILRETLCDLTIC
jgi:hypothetical protein